MDESQLSSKSNCTRTPKFWSVYAAVRNTYLSMCGRQGTRIIRNMVLRFKNNQK